MKKIIFFVASLSLFACQFNNSSRDKHYQDNFYNIFSYIDAKRVPLIKPYEAVNASGDWIVNSQSGEKFKTFGQIEKKINNTWSIYTNQSAFDVRYLTVLEGKIILLQCPVNNMLKDYTEKDSIFYLADIGSKTETFFFEQDSLNIYLKKIYSINSYTLMNIDSLYRSILKTRKLPWRSPDI